MKIARIHFSGHAGGTVEGGWADELKPQDDVHTIVEVHTDEGLSGIGSVFTSKALVEGAVKLLNPFLTGERADEPMRRRSSRLERPHTRRYCWGKAPRQRRNSHDFKLLARGGEYPGACWVISSDGYCTRLGYPSTSVTNRIKGATQPI